MLWSQTGNVDVIIWESRPLANPGTSLAWYRIGNVNSGLDLEVNGTTGVVDESREVSGSTDEQWTLALTE